MLLLVSIVDMMGLHNTIELTKLGLVVASQVF